jgi:GBP family porin
MNKKLLAVAVAAAMAPGVALAQSSVTISGIFKVGIDNLRIGGRAGSNSSEWRLTDNSSRIIFNVTEDLGRGMQAIAQLDVRFSTDVNNVCGPATVIAGSGTTNCANIGTTTINSGGNTWVGLRSKAWGTLTMGQHDLHYGKQPDDIATKAGALMATAVSLMDYAGGGGVAIAGGTRTRNVVRYDTPAWGIFSMTAAYSFNPTAVEADLTAANTSRKGRAWNLNPVLTGSVWQVGWSHWDQKADVAAAGSGQRGDVLYGYYRFGGFKIGAAWNKSRIKNDATGATSSNRSSWTIPLSYNWGSHNIYAHYTRARDDKSIAGDQGSRMYALAYVYDLSKRTSAGITYAKIRNNAGAAYNFFTNGNTGGFGSVNGAPAAGEDPRLLAFTIRHAF